MVWMYATLQAALDALQVSASVCCGMSVPPNGTAPWYGSQLGRLHVGRQPPCLLAAMSAAAAPLSVVCWHVALPLHS